MLVEHIQLIPSDFSHEFKKSYRNFSFLGACLTPLESDHEIKEDEHSTYVFYNNSSTINWKIFKIIIFLKIPVR